MSQVIDLRSDTVTPPTPEMRRAMAMAQVGDDGYGEDPTVKALETYAAGILGKEESVFLPSGTMANLVAMLAQCPRGAKVLVGDKSDIWKWEGGGASAFGGVVCQPVRTESSGQLSWEDLEAAFFQHPQFQSPSVRLICLENPHCLCNGKWLSLKYLAEVRALAVEQGANIHMDGARIFNAAVAMGTRVREIAAFADTVSFCLSKGLAAPAGSILAGSAGVIREARRLRQLLGGGMRQSGVLAAAGLIGLRKMRFRLCEDHANAQLLARLLADIPELQIDVRPPQTNIVFWNFRDPHVTAADFVHDLRQEGVLVLSLDGTHIRAVTHYGISKSHIEVVVRAVRFILSRGVPDRFANAGAVATVAESS